MTKADLNLSNEELLDSLNLISNGKLTRAAVMLFHRNPEKWVTGCYTKIGKFGIGSDQICNTWMKFMDLYSCKPTAL